MGTADVTQKVSIQLAKKRLTTVWFSGAGLLFATLLLQTALGRYGAKAYIVWDWLLPHILPTLALMLGVLIADARRNREATGTADRFLFRLAMYLSIGYLITVASTLVLEPLFRTHAQMSLAQLVEVSSKWLRALQSLVSTSLGAFFITKE